MHTTSEGSAEATRVREKTMADEDSEERPEVVPVEAAPPKETRAMRYYTAQEVANHNRADDCWVAIHHRVLDISELITQNRGVLTQPLVKHAGEDISHWFDADTLEVTKHVDPESNIELPFLPHGRFLHVAPPEPTAMWNTAGFLPWWRDPQYVVGYLTKRARWIEIVNVLTQQRHALQVCCEETIDDIQARYLNYNAHAKSYTWKFLDDDDFVPLQMNLTLEQNGILDETPQFEKLDMDEHAYKPSLYIYFNDDLSVA